MANLNITSSEVSIAAAVDKASKVSGQPKDSIIAVQSPTNTEMVIVLVYSAEYQVCWMYHTGNQGLHWGSYNREAILLFISRTAANQAHALKVFEGLKNHLGVREAEYEY